MNAKRFAILASLLVTVPFTTALCQTDSTVTYQINARHTGAISTPNLLPPLKIKWSVDLGATVGYPLIAGGMVYTITGPDSAGHVNLYGLDASSGVIVWGPVQIPEGFYWWAAGAYDNGVLYIVPNTISGLSSGEILAYNASDGQLIWSTLLPGQYFFTAPPTAGNGFVYTSGSGVGGTVYAVRESDGSVVWTASVMNGDNSSPVVTATAIYVSYVCPQTYKFSPLNGKQIWHYSGPCEGGGGATPALYNGLLYVRDWSKSYGHDGDILNAATGNIVDYFDADFAPALANNKAFYAQSASLTAVDTISGSTVWTAVATNDTYSTPPIYVNGIVYIGTNGGNILGYRSLTGKLAFSMNLGYGISAPETGSVSSPESGLGAAESMLVVPASTHLFALEH